MPVEGTQNNCARCASGQTSLHPAEFDPAALCLRHFHAGAARRSIDRVDASVFRGSVLSVEHAAALFLALSTNSERSRETYLTQIRKLLAWHPGRAFADITPHDLNEDIEWIQASVSAVPGARNRDGVGAAESYLTLVGSMFDKLQSLLPPDTGNPARAVAKPKRKQRGQREHYSERQLAQILRSVQRSNEAELFGLLLAILRTTGIRRMSLIGLNLEDIDFATGETIVRGKGGYVYSVYLSDKIRKSLLRIFRNHRRLTDDEVTSAVASAARARALWLKPETRHHPDAYDVMQGKGGTPALWTRRGVPVTRKTVERLIKAVRRGLPEGAFVRPFDIHSLRHTYIEQVKSSFGEDATKGLAGHWSNKSSSTTATSDYTMTRRGKAIAIQRFFFGPGHQFGAPGDLPGGAD